MSYTIIKADLKANKNDIRNIWRKNYTGVMDQKYEWIYHNNPAGAAHVWLIKHEESGEYVGVTALFPRQFVLNGKYVTGGITGDFLVHKDHRSMGPALMLQRSVLSAIQDGTVDFIYGYPNKASDPIIKRVGYKVLGNRVRLVKMLKTAPQLSKFPLGKYWAVIVSPFLDAALRLFSIKTWHYSKKDFVCEEIKNFDKRFDQLWSETCSQSVVTGVRRSDYLRWRFMDVPHSTNKIFAVFGSNKQDLKGYIVYRHIVKSIEIKAFLFPQQKKAFFALMSSFLRYARSSNSDSIFMALLKNNYIEKRMKNFGFVERKGDSNIYIFFPKKDFLEYPFLQDADSWLLLQSDNDDI